MNRYLFFFLLLVPLSAAQAQTQNAQRFTLEECVAYALENNVAVKNAIIDQKIANARVKETRGIGLPQVDASVSLQHNQKLRRFFGTYVAPTEGEEAFSLVPPIDGAETGDVIAGQNFFQLPSSGEAGIKINQILFNSSYLVGLSAASTYRELSEKTAEQTKEQTVQQVIKAYYTVLINNDRMNLFDNNIARVDSLLKSTAAMFENGF